MGEMIDRLAVGLARALVVGITRLPLQTAVRLGRFLGTAIFYVSNRRRVAYADLKAVFGGRFDERTRWRIVRNHFAHLGQVGIEMLFFPLLNSADLMRRITIHHKERFDVLMREKKPVVLLTAHYGNWELLQVIGTLEGRPIHVLQRGQKLSRLNRMISDLRKSKGSVAVTRGMGMREMIRALRRAEPVGLLGDQDAGKHEGKILRLLGRKTTVPTGPFELARRTGAVVLPAFITSSSDAQHTIHVEEPLSGFDEDAGLESAMTRYVGMLEERILSHPEQWLWAAKRWKYSWTKRLLILSDGKPGHYKQSEALAAAFQKIKSQYGRPGMEYPVQTILVTFRSDWLRRVFPAAAFLLMPWIQGRVAWLAPFFSPETARAIREASADFIISTGSSLVPLNLCLARECRAKSLVLMKPSFPFNLFRFDLALIPAHDRGLVPRESVRTLLAPAVMDAERLRQSGEKIQAELRHPGQVKIAVFLGGPTRRYQVGLDGIERLVSVLGRLAPLYGDYVLTTSRRTAVEVSHFLKQRLPNMTGCQRLVIGAEDTRAEVAAGMMAVAEILIVSEDSLSMISEALWSGKKVLVLQLAPHLLPRKHRRFLELLLEKKAVLASSPENLENALSELRRLETHGWQRAQEETMMRRLEAIL